ncbi:hypothetical protein ACQV5M_17065 [Leptospira sp. SA-E8]|uniref:hypothetical protein n=1 Tax=Leptospira sp. SA-E8 TaxID=3422259 RepID=UPI003EB728FF
MLIASLALGSTSAFAEEGSDPELSSQIIVEAEESISEELKSIYQEEVDQVLAEGISYSEEERLSDFPDLDSLLTDDIVPARVAKFSKDQKAEKGKRSDSELGIQNRKTIFEIFQGSSVLSQNCALGLNVLLPDLKVGQLLGQEFLPSSGYQGRAEAHGTSSVGGVSYADVLSGCAGVLSFYLSGEGSASELSCSIENQKNLLIGSGVPTTGAPDSGKTTENALGAISNSESGKIGDIALVSGKSTESRTFSQAVAGELSAEKLEAQVPKPRAAIITRKRAYLSGRDSYKFSSGRPTPEILT